MGCSAVQPWETDASRGHQWCSVRLGVLVAARADATAANETTEIRVAAGAEIGHRFLLSIPHSDDPNPHTSTIARDARTTRHSFPRTHSLRPWAKVAVAARPRHAILAKVLHLLARALQSGVSNHVDSQIADASEFARYRGRRRRSSVTWLWTGGHDLTTTLSGSPSSEQTRLGFGQGAFQQH